MLTILDPGIARAAGNIHGHPNSVKLKEHDPGAALKELVVTGLPANSHVFDLDPVEGVGSGKKTRMKRYSWFFREDHPVATKQCDGAISFSKNDIEYLFLIELKSSIAKVSHGRRQLESGRAFASYIQKLAGRPLTVCTRLIYVGPPSPAPVKAKIGLFRDHAEIGVPADSGRAFLSYSELTR